MYGDEGDIKATREQQNTVSKPAARALDCKLNRVHSERITYVEWIFCHCLDQIFRWPIHEICASINAFVKLVLDVSRGVAAQRQPASRRARAATD